MFLPHSIAYRSILSSQDPSNAHSLSFKHAFANSSSRNRFMSALTGIGVTARSQEVTRCFGTLPAHVPISGDPACASASTLCPISSSVTDVFFNSDKAISSFGPERWVKCVVYSNYDCKTGAGEPKDALTIVHPGYARLINLRRDANSSTFSTFILTCVAFATFLRLKKC